MSEHEISNMWADRFGLAAAPLFEERETDISGFHQVLMDGGHGSFALSITEERIWQRGLSSDWSWSCNLPHHVTISDEKVTVVRWDKEEPEIFSRPSVEEKIDAFYGYITSDKIKSNRNVVNYMTGIFRRVRSLVSNAGIEDDLSVDAFLEFLDYTIKISDNRQAPNSWRTTSQIDEEQILYSLSNSGVAELVDYVTTDPPLGSPYRCVPVLAVRHAGGEIFQEAHSELLRVPAEDMFGYVGAAVARKRARGGVHFTPPALARSIVEQTVEQVSNISYRDHLIVLDPACGSGVFLHETLRVLRKLKFQGHLTILGRDISRPAVSMARFVLANALRDWKPKGGCRVSVEVNDSLSEAFPFADVILMNPPFISWQALTEAQREQMHNALGFRLSGRGDYSMAFVIRAIEALNPGGALGTLFPRSLLNLQAAEEWRREILDRAQLMLLGSVGDYNLFSHAMIQIAIAVFKSSPKGAADHDDVTVLISENDTYATGDALRALRRASRLPEKYSIDNRWQLYSTSSTKFRASPTWRLMSNNTERIIDQLLDSGRAVRIDSVFDVHQGVRTGLNSAFVLNINDLKSLPPRERSWFRPATRNDSIVSGRIFSTEFVFYPYSVEGLSISTEEDLIRLLPHYFKKFLEPNRERLQQRSTILRSGRHDWWSLSERRTWALNQRPRLISKYFGGAGSFGVDLAAEYIVVQGFAWFPKWRFSEENEDSDFSLHQSIAAYASILNSKAFSILLNQFSPHVAGGQFDFSPRYVNHIPIPNILYLVGSDHFGGMINKLSELSFMRSSSDEEWHSEINQLTVGLYGEKLFERI